MSPTATAPFYNEDLSYVKDLKYVDESTRKAFPTHPQFASKLEERAWLKFRLAQAYRIFSYLEYNEGISGHITIRDPIKRDCFWLNPFGVHFSVIQPGDLILVDHEGNIQQESGPNRLLNKAGFMIHSAIHAARPDVLCIAHAHPLHGRAFGAFGRELDMYTQDSCAFYNDHAVYTEFNGLAVGSDEGKHISEGLGNKKAVILQNHGLLVAAPTIEAAVFFFASLERSCRVQLLIDAASMGSGKQPVQISSEEAYETYKTIGTLKSGWFSGLPEFQALEAREGVKFEFIKSRD